MFRKVAVGPKIAHTLMDWTLVNGSIDKTFHWFSILHGKSFLGNRMEVTHYGVNPYIYHLCVKGKCSPIK